MSLPNSYVEFLTLEVMAFGNEAFGRSSGHEVGTLMSGMSALIKRDQTEMISLCPVRAQGEGGRLQVRKKKGLTRSPRAGTLNPDCQPPELWEVVFVISAPPASGVYVVTA